MAVTLRDIAKHLGISHATVSFVLNNRMDMGITEATRQRVIAAAEELGYRPNRAARALTTGRTGMVAFCSPGGGDGYQSTILQGIQNEMKATDYEVVVWQPTTEAEIKKQPADLHVDGFFTLDQYLSDGAFITEDGSHKASINIGMVPREGWDNVIVDVSEAAVEAFQHLINVGCRRIAFLRPMTANEPKDSLFTTFQRLKSTPGIATDEILSQGLNRQRAMEAVRDFATRWGTPDGILCASDGLAIAAKRAFAEIGLRTPTDVAIVGCGGIEEAEYAWPPISTIKHPIPELCQTAWEFMSHRLEWPSDKPQIKTFKAEFLARESTIGFKRKR